MLAISSHGANLMVKVSLPDWQSGGGHLIWEVVLMSTGSGLQCYTYERRIHMLLGYSIQAFQFYSLQNMYLLIKFVRSSHYHWKVSDLYWS